MKQSNSLSTTTIVYFLDWNSRRFRWSIVEDRCFLSNFSGDVGNYWILNPDSISENIHKYYTYLK